MIRLGVFLPVRSFVLVSRRAILGRTSSFSFRYVSTLHLWCLTKALSNHETAFVTRISRPFLTLSMFMNAKFASLVSSESLTGLVNRTRLARFLWMLSSEASLVSRFFHSFQLLRSSSAVNFDWHSESTSAQPRALFSHTSRCFGSTFFLSFGKNSSNSPASEISLTESP